MTNLARLEPYTADDYRLWEGDWELIRGSPVAMTPAPGVMHQSLAAALSFQLYESLEACPHCQALYEIDVEFAADTVVRPDALVICYAPEGDSLTRAPELIFEIVSKSSARRDETIKFELYRQEGVSFYVLLYPENHKAKAYRPIDGAYRKIADFSNEKFVFELSKCSIDFDFSRLWRKKRASQEVCP